MKKVCTILASFVLLFIGVFSIFSISGCDFNVNYKETGNKLKEITTYISKSSNYESGKVTIDGEDYTYSCQGLPNVVCKTKDVEKYYEIEKYYDSAYAYAINYIIDNSNLLSQKPTVETLNEEQEELYKKLNVEIDEFFDNINAFEHEIENFNRYYNEIEKYSISSKELNHLNYKRAYRDHINAAYELINAIDNVADQVYKDVKYKEQDPTKETYKSFVKPINLKIINGYFAFIADSFDCRIPDTNENSNEHKISIVETYNKAKVSYINHFKKIIDGQKKTINLSDDKIKEIRKASTKYFEEMEIYKVSYEKFGFIDFFFEDDCDLNSYTDKNYANKNFYNKILDYMNYTLPSFTAYLSNNLYI